MSGDYLGRTLKDIYRIDDLLGEGGPSVVYRGTDLLMEVPIAIKRLKKETKSGLIDPQRFLREARTQAKLVHQNIVSVRAIIEEAGEYFIVMEYVQGEDLEVILKRSDRLPRLPLHETFAIFQQILSALGYAHKEQVIHRDIKPANIMLTREKQVKLADFGLARATHDSRITQMGVVLGTPAYMAPEQIRSKNVDHRSDIYSIGITLYEALLGFSPFQEPDATSSPFEVMRRQLMETPASLRSRGLDISDALEQVIAKSLAKKPEERYASCEDFLYALHHACLHDPLWEPKKEAPAEVYDLAHAVTLGAAEGITADRVKSSFFSRPPSAPPDSPPLGGPSSASPPPSVSPSLSPSLTLPDTEAEPPAPPTQAEIRSPLPLPSLAPPSPSPSTGRLATIQRLAGPIPSTLPPPAGRITGPPSLPPEPTFSLAPPQETPFFPPSSAAPHTGPSILAVSRTAEGSAGGGSQHSGPSLLGAPAQTSLSLLAPSPLSSAPSASQRSLARKRRSKAPIALILLALAFILCGIAFLWLSGSLQGSAKTPPPRPPAPLPYPQKIPDVPMTFIGAGAFLQGADSAPRESAYTPKRRVTLKAFWIDQFEVSIGQYALCVQNGSCKAAPLSSKTPDPTLPIHLVSWEDAVSFCAFAGKRLPTEAEWEKAARGVQGHPHPWGEDEEPLKDCQVAVLRGCSKSPLPTGPRHRSQGKSPFGIYDVLGNVREWVSDCFDKRAYKDLPLVDPHNDREGCEKRVSRGGGFHDDPKQWIARIFTRQSVAASTRRIDIGFRCAWSP